MSEYSSPAAWLETVVPAHTGYSGFRYLGTNPRTNRRLYAYWHERAVPAPAFLAETVATVRVTAERGIQFAIAGAAPIDAAASLLQAFGTRPVLLDCEFTQPRTPCAVCADAATRLCEILTALPPKTHAIVVHDPAALRFFPRSTPAIVQTDARADDLSLVLSATRYAGSRMVRIDAPHITGPVQRLADALGVHIVSTVGSIE